MRNPSALVSRPSARERLLDAAESLVTQRGTHGLTLDAVARQAGVSKGGLLFHYPHKRALIQAVVARLVGHYESAQADAMGKDPCDEGRFTRAYLGARVQSCGLGCRGSYTPLLMATVDGLQQLDEFRDRVATWQHKLEEDGIDPVIAHLVRLAADGIVLNCMLGFPFPAEVLCRKTVETLLSMTKAGEHDRREGSNCRGRKPSRRGASKTRRRSCVPDQ
jgi:AcrR family transcriptional regulator